MSGMLPEMAYRYETFNPYVLAEIPAGAKVLDVGTGTGLLGKNLRAKQPVSRLVGIEKDQAMAAVASQWYDEMVVADLERDEELLRPDDSFDVIVCSDVLEHLANPAATLARLSRYLADNGWFLISIPNVAFVSVRVGLLFGKFEYNPGGGIHDTTHLRFFTLKGFAGLLRDAGLSMLEYGPCNVVRGRYRWLKPLARLWPTLFALQFLVKAHRRVEG